MNRRHLFEFGDQTWLPAILRDGLTALLKTQSEAIYSRVIPKLQEFLLVAGTKEVIDIGSGSGGPWERLLPELQACGAALSVLFTDKFPPKNGIAVHPDIRFYPEPVDAQNIPENLKGCRTFFTAFHHFNPQTALHILQSQVLSHQPIAIFEFTERKWQNIGGMMLSPIVVWLQMPFIKPLKWQWLFFTYLLPLLPFIYCWDGLVSHWRSYTPAEIQKMIDQLPANQYIWEVGNIPDTGAGIKINYLLGWEA
ncbi:MAG: hypothetical protein SF052_12755 [Bacteroidia bacterium]|nr:hypothetical protein [Bacteroidia bacterium]